MAAPMVYVKVREPLPGTSELAVIDEVNPNVTTVEIATESPGGYGTARVGLLAPDADYIGRYPSLTSSYKFRDKAHVEIEVGTFRAHEGIMQEWSADYDGFSSVGYGLVAGEWGNIEAGGTHLAGARPLLIEAIKDVDWWEVGEITDPGSYRYWDDVHFQASSSVIDSIINEGDEDGPYSFLVYRNRRATVVAQVPPSRAHYVIGYDRSHMDLRYDASRCVDGARMTYTSASGALAATDPYYAGGVDRNATHLRVITLAGSSESGGLALQYLKSYVEYYSQPILSGSITYSDWDGPEGVAGYRVQAGQWIEFVGRGTAMITSTTSNLSTGLTSIRIGPPPPATMAALLRKAIRTARRLERHLDPTTGQRTQGKVPYDLMGIIRLLAESYLTAEQRQNTHRPPT
jgi:hypothetical protein